MYFSYIKLVLLGHHPHEWTSCDDWELANFLPPCSGRKTGDGRSTLGADLGGSGRREGDICGMWGDLNRAQHVAVRPVLPLWEGLCLCVFERMAFVMSFLFSGIPWFLDFPVL